MPDSETDKERASRILLESLEDSSIDEGSTSYTWSHYFQGRVEFYWETDSHLGVVLVVDAAEGDTGQVHSVVALEPLSEALAEMRFTSPITTSAGFILRSAVLLRWNQELRDTFGRCENYWLRR
jgi:hypothetical protein